MQWWTSRPWQHERKPPSRNTVALLVRAQNLVLTSMEQNEKLSDAVYGYNAPVQ